jgi:hypothetical protein
VFTKHDEKPKIEIDSSAKIDSTELYTVGLNKIGEVLSAHFTGLESAQEINVFSAGSKINYLDSGIAKKDGVYTVVKQDVPNESLISFDDENLYESD